MLTCPSARRQAHYLPSSINDRCSIWLVVVIFLCMAFCGCFDEAQVPGSAIREHADTTIALVYDASFLQRVDRASVDSAKLYKVFAALDSVCGGRRSQPVFTEIAEGACDGGDSTVDVICNERRDCAKRSGVFG